MNRPRLQTRALRSARGCPTGRSRQRGVYAIEFAFVFLLFFALLYATLCFGVLFTMRAGVQHAAEDGARAGMRYQKVAAGTSQLPARSAQAAQVAAQKVAGWLTPAPVVLAQVCQPDSGNCANPTCGPSWSQRCQIVVTVTATGLNQLLPMFHFALPDRLVGKASMLLDGRAP